jgi:hypothetical protein
MRSQNNGTNTWSSWTLQGTYQTGNKPVLASYFGRLYAGFRGLDGKGYVNNNATVWSDANNKIVRGITSDSFGMAGYNNKLCFLFRDNDQQNAQYCTNDVTLASEKYAIYSYFKSTTAPTLGADFHLTQISVAAAGNVNEVGVVFTTNQIVYRKLTNYSNVRGYISDMKWNTANAFSSDQTYEQEISMYKYNDINSDFGKLYMSDSTSPSPICTPTTSWTTSSLPSAYLDTRLDQNGSCDNSGGEPSFTLGSGSAKEIKANVVYINNYETAKGLNSKPIFKVAAQLGRQIPVGCLSEWCSFDLNRQIMVPFNPNGSFSISNASTFPYFVRSYAH